MAGLIIEGCATFVEYLGALNFIGHKLSKKNIREMIFFVLPIIFLTVGSNVSDIVSLNAFVFYILFRFYIHSLSGCMAGKNIYGSYLFLYDYFLRLFLCSD